MRILIIAISAFFATSGFAAYYGLRDKRLLLAASFGGAIGFLIYHIAGLIWGGNILPALLSAFIVGLLSEFFSRRLKAPALIMMLPGILPLVPGIRIYSMMVFFVNENFEGAKNEALATLFIAVSMAMGILLASLFSESLLRMRTINIPYIGRGKK